MSSGALATHSYWSTVCLGEFAIFLGRLVLLLLIHIGLQCVSVNHHLSRSSGTLATPLE